MQHPSASQILAENIRVHAEEAQHYDQMHLEILNRFEQSLIAADLEVVLSPCPDRAVDFGPGTGNLTLKLLQTGIAVTAVDISAEMLEALRDRTTGLDLKTVHAPIDDYLEDNSNLPPLVTMSSFLHQLPDPWKTLEHVCKRIPPGGMLYITHEPTGLPERGASKHIRNLDRLWWIIRHPRLTRMGRRIDYSISDFHAQAGLDPERMAALVRASGLELIRCRLYSSLKSAVLARISTSLGGASQVALVARRPKHTPDEQGTKK